MCIYTARILILEIKKYFKDIKIRGFQASSNRLTDTTQKMTNRRT